MSVDALTTRIAKALREISSTRGKAELGVYSGGQVTTASGTYAAVKAVPVSLYEGKQVWVQVTADGTAIIIGA